MEYIESLKKLKNCNSAICEVMADTLKKYYIDSDEIRKYINLCEIMVIRNKKGYCEDISIIPNDKLCDVIEFYTGISQDKLIKNNIKMIDICDYFSKFSYEELERIINLCRDFFPQEYEDDILEACNYWLMIKKPLLKEEDIELWFFDDSYLIEQVNIYIENTDNKNKILRYGL